jgi:uncharacterized protein
MRFNTILKLGPNRELTREGFTLFRNVSVSRTGEQLYGPDEGTGIEPGPDGYVYITRTPEEVFRAETLESGNGKSLVILHPDEDVTPENWRDLTHGTMFNLRKGTGEQSSESVCDLLIYTHEAVREIDLGMREVSLGYDADYYQTAPGRGEQRNIYINHVALVPAGRCGSSCAVRDHAHRDGDNTLKTTKKSFVDRILAAVRNKDEEGAKKAIEEMHDEGSEGGNETHIHVHTAGAAPKAEDGEHEPEDPSEARFKKLEDSVQKIADTLAERKTGDEAKAEEERKEAERKKAEDEETEQELEAETGDEEVRKAKDSALLADTFEVVKMNAEIIAPGIQIPTFDAKADPKTTFRDCVCGLRRKALRIATGDAETAEIIKTVRGRSLDAAQVGKMKCGEVRSLFNGVAAMKRNHNNGRLTVDSARQTTKTSDNKTPMEQFVAASAARWGGKK